MVIELRDSEHERVAQLLKELADAGHLKKLGGALEDEHSAYHCMCVFEEDLLDFEQKNRDSGASKGFYFVLGATDDPNMEQCPVYTGYSNLSPWAEYKYVENDETKMALLTFEPGYGVTVWEPGDFYSMKHAAPVAKVSFAEDSAIHLNQSYKLWRDIESCYMGTDFGGIA